MNGAHVRRIELGEKSHASPPQTAVQWKWRERSALPQVILKVSVGSQPSTVFIYRASVSFTTNSFQAFFYNILKLTILQPSLPNGKNGAGGPNAQLHAGRGSE